MNPAITAALLIAAQEEESEKLIIGRLREARATGPSSAIALTLDSDKQQLLEEAIAGGLVAKTSDGRFYLDERMVADRKDGQAFVALVIIIVGLSIVASGVALFLLVTR